MTGPATNTCINSAALLIACKSEEIKLFMRPTRDLPAEESPRAGTIAGFVSDSTATVPSDSDGGVGGPDGDPETEPAIEGVVVELVVLADAAVLGVVVLVVDGADLPSAMIRTRRACCKIS